MKFQNNGPINNLNIEKSQISTGYKSIDIFKHVAVSRGKIVMGQLGPSESLVSCSTHRVIRGRNVTVRPVQIPTSGLYFIG